MTKLNPLIEAMSNIDDALVEKAQRSAKAPLRIRTLVVAAAAALALGATAVGAVAVYNYNVNEHYASVLAEYNGGYNKQEYKTPDGEEVDQNAAALDNGLYDKLNIELGQSFECEDFTIDFPGAICDGKEILVMFNITFNKDLDCLDYPQQFFWVEGYNTANNEGLREGSRNGQGFITEVDGKKVYSSYKNFAGIENCGESVNLHFDKVSAAGGYAGSTPYRVDVDIDLEIPLTNDFTDLNKTLTPDTPQHIDIGGWGKWDVESVEISSLAFAVNAKFDDGEVPECIIADRDRGWPIFPINIIMKDGSVLELTDEAISRYSCDPETNTATFGGPLGYPLDVDNVQSFQFANAIIDIDGSATTVEIPEPVERYPEM